MFVIALKMLTGNTGKYLGLVAGIFFSALIITQQLSIFTGLMSRTFGFIDDTRLPDLWVMDQKVQFIDDIKPLSDTKLLQVRGVQGVRWAMPLYKGILRVRLTNGNFQNCNVVGVDDATLIGGPPTMIVGTLADLRRADGVIVDETGARGKLARVLADGTRIPLQVGDVLELNDRRAVVVGIASVSRTFQSQPVIYTTYSRAMSFAPRERKLLSFILVKADVGKNILDLSKRIQARTGLAAYSTEDFSWLTVKYFMKYTGIPINFGIAVVLGFIVGCAIAAQTLYGFVLDNLKYLGALKAMGATNWLLLRMIMLQAAVVGIFGYGLGVGVASLFSLLVRNSELAFRMPWQVLAVSFAGVTLICIISAVISAIKVLKLEPAMVFRS